MPDVAFDAASSAAPATGTSRTWSLTVGAGANRLLLVYPEIDSTNDWVTGVTYNGVAMTRIAIQSDAVGMTGYLYGLLAPASGTNNVIISTSNSVSIAGCAYAVANAKQTLTLDAISQGNNGGAGVSTRLWGPTTTVTDRALVALFTWNSAEVPVASTNSTARSVVNKEASVFDRGAVTTPAGDVYMTQTTTTATRWSTIAVAIAPVAAVTGITRGAVGSGINPTTATTITATITGTPTAGSTWVVGIVSRSATETVSGFTDDSSGGPMVFTQIGSWVNGATNSRTSLWSTAVGGGKAGATVITATLGIAERDTVIVATEWLNVVALGINGSTSNTTANPSIALTTQDANNFVVAVFGARGATVPTSLTGTLEVALASDGGSPVSGALVSNTSATAASVTAAETLAAATWMALAIELRTTAGGGGTVPARSAVTMRRRRLD